MKLTWTLPLFALAGCGEHPGGIPAPPPAVEVRTVEVVKEVQRPCPVEVPQRPAKLPGTLPEDAVALAALLGRKLDEYAGPGKYADKADSALRKCTQP